MMDSSNNQPLSLIGRALIVPTIMLGGIGLYLYDAAGLSTVALIFPAGLISAILGALIWLAIASARGGHALQAQAEEDEEASGPILDARPWTLVALSALMVFSFDYLGALPSLIILVLGAQLIFSMRSPLKSLAIALAVTVPTYLLFQYFLFVRFPRGLLGIG
jgi:hypothetical protein